MNAHVVAHPHFEQAPQLRPGDFLYHLGYAMTRLSFHDHLAAINALDGLLASGGITEQEHVYLVDRLFAPRRLRVEPVRQHKRELWTDIDPHSDWDPAV